MSEGLDVEAVMQTATDLMMAWGLSAIGAIAVLLVGAWVARRIREALRGNLPRAGLDTMLRVLESEDRVLEDPAPMVAVSELGDSSVNFVVRPWCNASDYWPLRWHLNRRLKEELEATGCSIPFPQRDVHLFQEAQSG